MLTIDAPFNAAQDDSRHAERAAGAAASRALHAKAPGTLLRRTVPGVTTRTCANDTLAVWCSEGVAGRRNEALLPLQRKVVNARARAVGNASTSPQSKRHADARQAAAAFAAGLKRRAL